MITIANRSTSVANGYMLAQHSGQPAYLICNDSATFFMTKLFLYIGFIKSSTF